ncbi:MAG: hypothetical protein Q3999_04785 [Buchananella hordeovulneris]|nr:hypothetical protein [Buchananella hordeovulneris]
MSVKKSWLALLIMGILVLAYCFALMRLDGFRELVGDSKGLSGLLIVAPLGVFWCCLVESYRVGWSLLRAIAAAATGAAAMAIGYGFVATQVDAFFVYGGIYIVFGLVGEGSGQLVRRLVMGKQKTA